MSEVKRRRLTVLLCEIVEVSESLLDKKRVVLENRIRKIAKEADDLLDDLNGLFGEIDEVSLENSVNKLGTLVEGLNNELYKV